MLTCQEVTAIASLMVDGELGFRERIAVRMHLMMCVNCQRFARQFEALVSSMASRNRLKSEAIVSEFVDRVMQLENRRPVHPGGTANKICEGGSIDHPIPS